MKVQVIKRAAIYGRVSTDGQTVDNQLRELRMVAERNGWHIVRKFVEQELIPIEMQAQDGEDMDPAVLGPLQEKIKAGVPPAYELRRVAT